MNTKKPEKSEKTSQEFSGKTLKSRRFSSGSSAKQIRVIVVILLLSLGGHALTLIQMDNIARYFSSGNNSRYKPKDKVKIRIVQTPKKKAIADGTILETKLKPTKPPKNADFLSHQDHSTDKETRAKDTVRPKNGKIGQKGTKEKTLHPPKSKKPIAAKPKSKKLDKRVLLDPNGTVSITPEAIPGKSEYESLIPTSIDLSEQLKAGYNEYIDKNLPEGDRVDVNTTQFRFMGYFTSMRKSVELVLDYPQEAIRRRIQGNVSIGFEILQDGTVSKIKILESSGYDVLDNAWIEAIKLASPFSPLPENINRTVLPVSYRVKFALGG